MGKLLLNIAERLKSLSLLQLLKKSFLADAVYTSRSDFTLSERTCTNLLFAAFLLSVF